MTEPQGWQPIEETLARVADAIEAECHRAGFGLKLKTARAIAEAAITAMQSGWQPIESAPRDGTVILGLTRSDLEKIEDSGWSPDRWANRYVPMRHEGVTPGGYDMGWSVALPVGHGGLPDEWFEGWMHAPQRGGVGG